MATGEPVILLELFAIFYVHALSTPAALCAACYIAGVATPILIAMIVARRNGVPL